MKSLIKYYFHGKLILQTEGEIPKKGDYFEVKSKGDVPDTEKITTFVCNNVSYKTMDNDEIVMGVYVFKLGRRIGIGPVSE